ncbi:calcium-binding protein [Methylorubrum rhodinum]
MLGAAAEGGGGGGHGADDLTEERTGQRCRPSHRDGNGGANVLDGRAGADVMTGYGGSDTFHVDNAGDRTVEVRVRGSDAVTDTVVASVGYALKAGENIEVLRTIDAAGKAAINLTGNAYGQTVVGNNGANVLNGDLGQDVLTGRGGADTFVFDTALGAGNVDRITDFSAPADTIRLENAISTALGAGELASDRFKDLGVAGAKLDASDRIVYDRTTGVLSYDADGSGTKAAMVQVALIDTKAVLTAADFFVV